MCASVSLVSSSALVWSVSCRRQSAKMLKRLCVGTLRLLSIPVFIVVGNLESDSNIDLDSRLMVIGCKTYSVAFLLAVAMRQICLSPCSCLCVIFLQSSHGTSSESGTADCMLHCSTFWSDFCYSVEAIGNHVSPIKWNECAGSYLALSTIFTLPMMSTDSQALTFLFLSGSRCVCSALDLLRPIACINNK